MKRLKKVFLGLAIVGSLALFSRLGMAATSPFTVTVTTVVPNGALNGSAAFTAASFPNYTGTVSVRRIFIDNLNSAQAERVTLWTTCTSSTVATLKWQGVVPASSTLNVTVEPRLFPMTSPCFSKGVIDSNSQIKATLFYE